MAFAAVVASTSQKRQGELSRQAAGRTNGDQTPRRLPLPTFRVRGPAGPSDAERDEPTRFPPRLRPHRRGWQKGGRWA